MQYTRSPGDRCRYLAQRMRFNTRSLLILIATIGFVIGCLSYAGWFAADFEQANNNIRKKLEERADLEVSNWTVSDLTHHINKDYKIPILVSDAYADKQLDDLEIKSIRLKNSIRLALSSQNLSYAIKNGRLEIVSIDHPEAVSSMNVYSTGDLVKPKNVR